MTDVAFYHLTRSSVEQALPPLLERTLAAGQRAVVRGDAARLQAVSRSLWEAEWLPHGGEADGDVDLQPIWLATDDAAPNGAKFLFLADGGSARLEAFERVFDLFDGGDPDTVAAARTRWAAARAAGHALTYWQQGERGWQRAK